MEAHLLSRVVFVKDPSALPEGMPQHAAVDLLAKNNKAVILLSHDAKYVFPKDWVCPANVSIIEYALDVQSITACVIKLREILKTAGVDMYSRHLDTGDPMPMLLAGACLTLSSGTKIAFVNQPSQFATVKLPNDEKPVETDWDID
jgi:hypothetical protein